MMSTAPVSTSRKRSVIISAPAHALTSTLIRHHAIVAGATIQCKRTQHLPRRPHGGHGRSRT